MKVIGHKTEIVPIFLGASASVLAAELLEKIVITTLAMLIGTTISYFWRKYLEKRDK